MNHSHNSSQRGFIKYIILIVIAIFILSYLGFDIKRIVEADQTRSNFSYVWLALTHFWQTFLQEPALWVWHVIIVGIFWKLLLLPTLNILQNIASHQQ
jgi:hypothetical protein